jgi:hypothetical protein
MHNTFEKVVIPIERTPLYAISMASLTFQSQLCILIAYNNPCTSMEKDSFTKLCV